MCLSDLGTGAAAEQLVGTVTGSRQAIAGPELVN